MKKRALALLLSICVAFSVVPEVALAEEPVEVDAEAIGEEVPEEESEQIQEEVKSLDDTYMDKEPENAEESQNEPEIDVANELAQEGSGETIEAECRTGRYVQNYSGSIFLYKKTRSNRGHKLYESLVLCRCRKSEYAIGIT